MNADEILRRAYLRAREDFIPVCGEECAGLLRELCGKVRPSRILEIGTAVGYSSSVMALACEAEVDTIEYDGDRLDRAKQLWKELGISAKVTGWYL